MLCASLFFVCVVATSFRCFDAIVFEELLVFGNIMWNGSMLSLSTSHLGLSSAPLWARTGLMIGAVFVGNHMVARNTSAHAQPSVLLDTLLKITRKNMHHYI